MFAVIVSPIVKIGLVVTRVILIVGRFFLFTASATKSIFFGLRLTYLVSSIRNIVVSMTPIIALTAVSTGAVITLQMYNGFSRFNVDSAIPMVVSLSLARELAPIMSTIILISRFITSSTSEIAYMKISQQIDALKILSLDPMHFLVSHRVLATIISMPIVYAMFYLIGLFGGYVVSVYLLDFSGYGYINQCIDVLHKNDIISGLVKSLSFGFLSIIIACYNGFFAGEGVNGVSRAVIDSVVLSVLSMFTMNYILTALLF